MSIVGDLYSIIMELYIILLRIIIDSTFTIVSVASLNSFNSGASIISFQKDFQKRFDNQNNQ